MRVAQLIIPGLALLTTAMGCCKHINYIAGRCDCNPPPVEYLLMPPTKPLPMGGLLTPPAKAIPHGTHEHIPAPKGVTTTPAQDSSIPAKTPAPDSTPAIASPGTPPVVNGSTTNPIPIPAPPVGANVPGKVPAIEAAPPMPKVNQPD
jgi:hypothetical protein